MTHQNMSRPYCRDTNFRLYVVLIDSLKWVSDGLEGSNMLAHMLAHSAKWYMKDLKSLNYEFCFNLHQLLSEMYCYLAAQCCTVLTSKSLHLSACC